MIPAMMEASLPKDISPGVHLYYYFHVDAEVKGNLRLHNNEIYFLFFLIFC
jgi:hypothetical protein